MNASGDGKGVVVKPNKKPADVGFFVGCEGRLIGHSCRFSFLSLGLLLYP